NMRTWTKPGKLTPVRPPPGGNPAGTGQQLSLNNPFGARPPAAPNTAPNQPPGPPPMLVQMTGQPAVGAKRPAMKPRSGDEGRQGADSATRPSMDQLSPADRVATIGHLASTLGVAASHAAVHQKAVEKEAAKPKPNRARLQHNAAHAAKHSEEV